MWPHRDRDAVIDVFTEKWFGHKTTEFSPVFSPVFSLVFMKQEELFRHKTTELSLLFYIEFSLLISSL